LYLQVRLTNHLPNLTIRSQMTTPIERDRNPNLSTQTASLDTAEALTEHGDAELTHWKDNYPSLVGFIACPADKIKQIEQALRANDTLVLNKLGITQEGINGQQKITVELSHRKYILYVQGDDHSEELEALLALPPTQIEKILLNSLAAPIMLMGYRTCSLSDGCTERGILLKHDKAKGWKKEKRRKGKIRISPFDSLDDKSIIEAKSGYMVEITHPEC